MPWSVKAQELIRQQYAAVGAAAHAALGERVATLEPAAAARAAMSSRAARAATAQRGSLRQPVRRRVSPLLLAGESRRGPELAPFHLLATRRHGTRRQDHVWHMETLARLARPTSKLAAGHAASQWSI